MPRKSAASLGIAPLLDPAPLPPVPEELSPAERQRWLAFVVAKPVGWFDIPGLALLTQMVRHLSALDRLNGMVDAQGGEDIEALDRLLKMRTRETAAVKALATALRLTVQSKYDPQRAHTISLRGGRVPRPWDRPNKFANNGLRLRDDD